MNQLIEKIINKQYKEANKLFESEMVSISERKIVEMKKMIAAKMDEAKKDLPFEPDAPRKKRPDEPTTARGLARQAMRKMKAKVETDKKDTGVKKEQFVPTKTQKKVAQDVLESEQIDEAQRIKIIRARIRGGKIQRRKRVSNVPGMTIRGGKLIRMSPAERRRRKMGQRRGKLKRRAKKNQMLRKRKLSLIKRSRLGV